MVSYLEGRALLSDSSDKLKGHSMINKIEKVHFTSLGHKKYSNESIWEWGMTILVELVTNWEKVWQVETNWVFLKVRSQAIKGQEPLLFIVHSANP